MSTSVAIIALTTCSRGQLIAPVTLYVTQLYNKPHVATGLRFLPLFSNIFVPDTPGTPHEVNRVCSVQCELNDAQDSFHETSHHWLGSTDVVTSS